MGQGLLGHTKFHAIGSWGWNAVPKMVKISTFYPCDALPAWSLLPQRVCLSVTVGIVLKRIKISPNFILCLVAPPHRFSNATHHCKIITGRGACQSGGLRYFQLENA